MTFEPGDFDPERWDENMVTLRAMFDQMVAISRGMMKAVADYEQAALAVGVSPRVAEELALRFAARLLPLPTGFEGTWDKG